MNKIYKVIWSHVKQCYVVTSELAKAHGRTSIGVGTSRLAVAALTAFVLTAGVTSAGLAADKDIVDKGAQPIAYDISPANDGTNIAIGKNAKVFIGGGTQESMLSFGEKVNEGSFSMDIHDNNHAKQNLPEAIAVGTNSYARTGSIEIGAHTLAENKISIGDTTADKLRQFGVASTTLGTNSYTGGGFATTIGSYNVQTSPYEAKDKWDTLGNATKNAFSTVIGTFNSNESMTGSRSSGVANIISGMANKVTNSNGAIVMGAGNSVKESSSYIDASPYSTHFDSAADMQKALMDGVASSAGGATLVIGGANSAEKTQNSQIMGVGNSMKSTTYKKVQYNYLDGFNSSITDASHVKVLGQGVTINKGADSNTVIGDYRTVAEDQTHNVIIGNADETAPITTEKKDTVILGHNANATIDGGVAIGAGSVAVIDKDQVGYDPANGDHHTDTTGTWKSKAAAVSVGQIVKNEQGQLDAEKTITRQITNVAAGTQDTDAVNVAQLKAVSDTVDASKTKYYSVRDIPFTSAQYAEYTNEKNDGAKEMGALAAGYMTYAGGIASTVTGSLSGVINQAAASGRQDFRGATALSYGTFNINNNTENSGAFSGVANSIVGQANVTTDSNAAMVYGAGNSVTNSYRAIDVQKAGAIMQGLKDPRQLNEALKAAVPTSGAQVMVMGGGNTVDKAYMTQVVGVGNTVTGSDKEYVEGTSTQLNYVDGFYNKVENGKNDYVIGSHNTLTGSNVDTNKSNLVLGDNHKLTDRTNNVILGSADKELTTSASDAVLIGHNADVKVDGGVALGSGSVASTDKDVEGYDPLKKGASESSDKAWKSSWAAVSVGDGTHTRQITGVAAGFADTDAVNVAQLKSVASLPVHIYSGGKVSSGSYTAGGPVANPTISSLQFDFGDGLKAEEVGAEGDKRVLVSLDKDALKGDPDFKGDKGEKGDTGA
ncbi:ESPR-type extended signal peptide-containing protein, partial [Megasphaera sp. UBA4382]|uniref:ESPR-type extended signal peptide-containing protein n=1 Tax=Megasphaera sp. UBA4382 TaxID=1946850 RepID=UPI0025BBA3E5